MNGTSCFHRTLILEISSLRYPITDSRIHTPYAFTCKIYKVSIALSVNSRDTISLGRPSGFIYSRVARNILLQHIAKSSSTPLHFQHRIYLLPSFYICSSADILPTIWICFLRLFLFFRLRLFLIRSRVFICY